MPLRRPPHLAEQLYAGYVRVFLTMCTFHRRRYFTNLANVDAIRHDLLTIAEEFALEIIAYCFMPDHVHVLIGGTCDKAEVLAFARKFRQLTGYRFRNATTQRLWQDGYFDHILRDGEKTFEVVRYIVNNPVRAGLVDDPCRYPFSGSDRYSVADLVCSVQWRSI